MYQSNSLSDTFMVGLRAQIEELRDKERLVLQEFQNLIDSTDDLELRATLLRYLLTAHITSDCLDEAMRSVGADRGYAHSERWTTVYPIEGVPLEPAAEPLCRAERLAGELVLDYSRACKWAALLNAAPATAILQRELESRRRGYEQLRQSLESSEPSEVPAETSAEAVRGSESRRQYGMVL